MHRAAPSPRAMPPPRRSARLHRSPSGSGSGSGSASPPPHAPTPRKRAKAKMRLSQAEEVRSIEQVIDSSADDSETATISGSASGTPSPVRRKRVQELEREDQQPDPPAAEPEPDIARGRPLLLPFVVGALAIVLGVLSLFPFKYPLEEAPPLRLERALPLLTAHVRAVGALLPRAREMQRPALDHLAVRELRDAARLSSSSAPNANLDAPANSDTDTPKLADELEALGAQLMAAKMRALDLGVALWLAGRATHNELHFALSSFTSPSSSSSSNTPTSTATAAASIASATRFLASSAADLHTLANDTAALLQDAYTFGTTVTASPAFAALVSSAGKTPRSRWLGTGSGVGEELAGLRGSVERAQEAIRRAGALGRAARDLAGEAEGIGERLRGVFAADDPQHPPKSHADPAQTAKLAAELRAALEALAAQVAQVQPDTG